MRAKGKAKTVWENLIISSKAVNLPQPLFVIDISINVSFYNGLVADSSNADFPEVCYVRFPKVRRVTQARRLSDNRGRSENPEV
jgi:hypothetical protein